MPIDFDMTRLLWALTRSTPTGIDRVEHETLQGLLNLDCDVQGIVVMPYGRHRLTRAALEKIAARAAHNWGGLRDDAHTDSLDPDLAQILIQILATAPDTRLTTCQHLSRQRAHTHHMPLGEALWSVGQLLGETRPWSRPQPNTREAVFYTTSQWQLQHVRRFQWLKQNPKKATPAVAFLHDVIPLEFPEFCGTNAFARHLARLKTLGSLFDAVIVNSHSCARDIRRVCQRYNVDLPPLHVAPLGVTLTKPQALRPIQHPYFVCLGTLEPRKNIPFLLALWKQLVSTMGPKTPRLVLIGRRGWDCEDVVRTLQRAQSLAPFVIEVSDLGDAACAQILAQARGLLSPSFAEGFNLPLAEAQALGVPIVASDIPAHREVVTHPQAQFCDPLDGPAWRRTIISLCAGAGPRAMPMAPVTWQDHCAQVFDILQKVQSKQA